MKRLLATGFAFALLLLAAEAADAQVYQVYYPPVPVTTYYSPAPAVAVAPVATTAYYTTAVPVTRYRPLTGGYVTRWRYVNQPVVYPTTAYYPVW